MGMGNNVDNGAGRGAGQAGARQPSALERLWLNVRDRQVGRRRLLRGAAELTVFGLLPAGLVLVACAKGERAADQTLHTVDEQIALMEGLRGFDAAAGVLVYPKVGAGERPQAAYGHAGLIKVTLNGQEQLQVVTAQHVIEGIEATGSDTMVVVFPGTVSAEKVAPGAKPNPYQIEIPLARPPVKLSEDFLMDNAGRTDSIFGYAITYGSKDPLGKAISTGGITPLTLRKNALADFQRFWMIDPDGKHVTLKKPSDKVFPSLYEFEIDGNTGRTCIGDSGKPIVVQDTGEVYGILNAVAAQEVDPNKQNGCGLRGGYMVFGGPALLH